MKNDFYSFGDSVISYEINQEEMFEYTLLDYENKQIYIINDAHLELKKYYYVDVFGNSSNDKSNRIIVQISTYKDKQVLEKFNLGINSIYNIVYFKQDFDEIRMNLYVYGTSKVKIDSLNFREITDFLTIDSVDFDVDKGIVDNFQNLMPSVMKNGFSEKFHGEILDKIKDNIFAVENKGLIYYYNINDIIDYNNSSITDRSIQLYISKFDSVGPYFMMLDDITDFVHRYYNLIEIFIDEKRYVSYEDGLIYNDWAIAGRVHNWILFYSRACKYLTCEQRDKLITSIVYQAKLLNESHFNSRGTNHGLQQDLIYLEYLTLMCNDYDIKSQIEENYKKVIEYFYLVVSSNGVHLEHSPRYHSLIIASLINVINIYNLLNIDVLELENLKENMIQYLSYITKPDGYLPEISDTDYMLNEYKIKDIKDKFKVFKDEGYAVFKNDNTYILFYNAYNSHYHKHSDENGLWIYRDGDIVREAGRSNYNYEDPYTKYAYSSWSHNTLIVNDRGLVDEKNIPNDYNYEGTYIENYKIDENLVVGVTTRYNDIRWKRVITYDENKDVICSNDYVESSNRNKYTFLWNLDISVNAIKNGNVIDLYRNDRLIMTISFDIKEIYNLFLIYGQDTPNIIGYKMVDNKPVKTYTIKIDINSSSNNINFKTYFEFK